MNPAHDKTQSRLNQTPLWIGWNICCKKAQPMIYSSFNEIGRIQREFQRNIEYTWELSFNYCSNPLMRNLPRRLWRKPSKCFGKSRLSECQPAGHPRPLPRGRLPTKLPSNAGTAALVGATGSTESKQRPTDSKLPSSNRRMICQIPTSLWCRQLSARPKQQVWPLTQFFIVSFV